MRVLENYECRTKFNSSLGMEYNGGLYGFSAVKVKLVIDLKTVQSPLNSSSEAANKADLTLERAFILNTSFSKFPYFH